jgi:hypothetical protein
LSSAAPNLKCQTPHESNNQIEFRAKVDAFNEAVKRMSNDTSQLDALRDKHQKVFPKPQTPNPKP